MKSEGKKKGREESGGCSKVHFGSQSKQKEKKPSHQVVPHLPATPGVPWSSWMGVNTPAVRADAVKLSVATQAHDSSCDRGTLHLPSPLQEVTVRDKAECRTAASQS